MEKCSQEARTHRNKEYIDIVTEENPTAENVKQTLIKTCKEVVDELNILA